MALTDYMQMAMAPKAPDTQNSLAIVDENIQIAEKNANNRKRAEEIDKQITNLESQNAELRASLENLRKNTLSNMDEDKIVAMAKAKGIKNEDIDEWLKGRAQRSAREISGAQTRELERQAEELKEQNKAQDVQAIYEADQDYAKAFEDAKYRSQDETEASMDKNVLAKKNKLDTLKSQFKRHYGVTWEDYTKQPEGKEKLSVTVTEEEKEEGKGGEVVLLEEEVEALESDENTRGLVTKFNERDTPNKEKRDIKQKARFIIKDKEKQDAARQSKLNEIKGHLKTLGITKDTKNVTQAFNEARKTTDKIVRNAYDEVIKFMREDKVYNSYSKIKDLL